MYKKGHSVFGIDEAWREACRTGLFYLVEGAPDAMKMHAVGINNAVAPLGGAWTREQLLLLKKAAPAVCFINDADPVPAGGGWGPGVEYVLRNGQLAVELGLGVTVRELPCAEGNRKQDPGSFFTSRGLLKQLPEEDFVVWAAGKWFRPDDTVARRTENVRRVAELAGHIADEMQLELILPALCKLSKGKEMWRGAINQARWQRTKKEEARRDGVDLRQYGFFQQAGCYFGQTEKGGELQWSNFTMRPLFHVRDAEQPRRLFHFRSCRGREDIVEMTMEDLNSPSRFRQKIEGIGNYIWMGGEREMIKLKNYLYDQTETAGIIRQMGWSAQGFYAFGNGVWREGEFHRADEYGVVRLGQEAGNWYIPAASKIYRDQGRKFEWERKFVHAGLNSVRSADYLRDFVRVHGDNGKVGLCYWVASLFRDIIAGHTRSFPLLDLFGPKGSGKTELGAALMAFFVTDNKAPNLRNSTAVALNDAVAFASDALVHLDEYKNDIDAKKIEFLKGLYDGVGRVKMSGTGFDSRVMTSVRCGVVMSGQEIPTADIALFHRCIYLAFPRSEFTDEERHRFAALREVQKLGLTALTLEVLRLRKRFEGGFLDTYNAVLDDINRQTGFRKLETRIVENWAKALAAFRCVETKLPWPFGYEEMLRIAVEGILVQNRMSGEGNEVAKFWEIAQYLRDNGELFNESDWRIQTMARIKTDRLERTFPTPASILLLNTSRIFILYKRACISMGSKPLPDDALREYLKNSDYYLGNKAAVRFKSIIKGYEECAPDPEQGKANKMGKVMRAMCFDYAVIKERYGVTLATSSLDACADEDTAPAPPPAQPAGLPF